MEGTAGLVKTIGGEISFGSLETKKKDCEWKKEELDQKKITRGKA